MSHYLTTVGRSKKVHASPVETGAILYCQPSSRPKVYALAHGAELTCQVCRRILSSIWQEQVTGPDVNKVIYIILTDEGQARIGNLEHVDHEGEPFVRFRYESPKRVMDCFYTLEHLLQILIDGNAFTVARLEGR